MSLPDVMGELARAFSLRAGIAASVVGCGGEGSAALTIPTPTPPPANPRLWHPAMVREPTHCTDSSDRRTFAEQFEVFEIYDFAHGQQGRSRNCIELHPILAIENEGALPVRTSA